MPTGARDVLPSDAVHAEDAMMHADSRLMNADLPATPQDAPQDAPQDSVQDATGDTAEPHPDSLQSADVSASPVTPKICDQVGSPCEGICGPSLHPCGNNVCRRKDDPSYCGESCVKCGEPKNGKPVCVSGRCNIMCNNGWHRNGNSCVECTQSSHCKPKGAAWEATCSQYSCSYKCAEGYQNCDGSCKKAERQYCIDGNNGPFPPDGSVRLCEILKVTTTKIGPCQPPVLGAMCQPRRIEGWNQYDLLANGEYLPKGETFWCWPDAQGVLRWFDDPPQN
jgi:hypothetical protein